METTVVGNDGCSKRMTVQRKQLFKENDCSKRTIVQRERLSEENGCSKRLSNKSLTQAHLQIFVESLILAQDERWRHA
ncbi:conserved domain protein [Heliomicrobium modesticaldum Ice1]|uniref:Conserved domain protein n=1 Tax=Heliobacterium modesticaldum (strain ATCC 51547 / Ice1) TaxID=498761 RepID=B0TG18_HELMI|nr:conserved domain protein [Heliomicrobium modesticaldum Ice1]